MSPAEEACAVLTGGQRARLLRGVFHVLEYDQDGEPGGEWVSALADAEHAGEPDDADAADPPGEHPHDHGDYSDVQ
jgi:hypothetical protein